MCFSAGASFTSGAVLAVVGIASFRNAKTTRQKLFAGIPLIFSVQQITEGFLWLSLGNSNLQELEAPMTVIFLIIAQVIWPVWVPLSIGLLEKKESRKKIFFFLTFIGTGISVWISYCLLNFPVHAVIEGHHVSYKLGFPDSIHMIGGVSYFVATVFPPFFSTVKKMPLLGALILASYIISAIFFEHYVISVWCFLAAIISAVVYFISKEVGETAEPELKISTLK